MIIAIITVLIAFYFIGMIVLGLGKVATMAVDIKHETKKQTTEPVEELQGYGWEVNNNEMFHNN